MLRSSPWARGLWRLIPGCGKSRRFCCASTRGCFESRKTYGRFVVAGFDPRWGRVAFYSGTAMAHRSDYDRLIPTLRAADQALEGLGLSNYKLLEYSGVSYCQTCGADLRRYYGIDGGLLRDDGFVAELTAPFESSGQDES